MGESVQVGSQRRFVFSKVKRPIIEIVDGDEQDIGSSDQFGAWIVSEKQSGRQNLRGQQPK